MTTCSFEFPSGVGNGKAGARLETFLTVLERRSVEIDSRESFASENVIPKWKEWGNLLNHEVQKKIDIHHCALLFSAKRTLRRRLSMFSEVEVIFPAKADVRFNPSNSLRQAIWIYNNGKNCWTNKKSMSYL